MWSGSWTFYLAQKSTLFLKSFEARGPFLCFKHEKLFLCIAVKCKYIFCDIVIILQMECEYNVQTYTYIYRERAF